MSSGAVEQLRAAVDALATDEVVGCAQRDDVLGLWREIARLDAQFARRLGEFDRSVEWSVDGARSAAGWLVANTRASSGEAHHRVKVARQVAEMPVTAAAWNEGAISSRHVDAAARVRHGARADAEFAVYEPALVGVARTGQPEHVAGAGAQWREALDTHLGRDGSERHRAREHDGRNVAFSRTLDGVGILDGRFDAEGAEIIETAIRRSYDRLHVKDDARSPGQQRADAEVDIHRHYLDHQDRGTNRPHVIVAVDDATLAGEQVGLCETLSGHRLGAETVRRLACDAIVQRIVIGADGVLLDMGRATRTFTPDQYRAIMLRDGGCRFPGCDAHPEHCEAHHAMVFWEDGGATDLANGLAVCRGRGHHRLVHEGGWTVEGDPNGELTFFDPGGNHRGSTRPRNLPPPIPTRTGNEITRIHERAHDLQRRRAAEPLPHPVNASIRRVIWRRTGFASPATPGYSTPVVAARRA
jgi:Domain of unknown function (DUF222)